MGCYILGSFHPVLDAFGAEEVSAASAFFGLDNNISADGAVEHVSGEVGEAVLVVAVLSHFVDSKNSKYYTRPYSIPLITIILHAFYH